MDIGVEISLYPLQPGFRSSVHAFIDRLQSEQRLRIVTNSMSTQIFGDYELVMSLLTRELRGALGIEPSACVIKLFGPLPS